MVLVACGDEPTPKLRKRSGMNPYLEYLNHKLATFKSLFAPGRDLSQDERGKVLQKCERDWVAMSDVAKRPWSMVYKSAANLRVLGPIVEACPSVTKKPFRGVWQAAASANRHDIITPAAILTEYNAKNRSDRSKAARHDPSLFVVGAVQQRVAKLRAEDASVFGCYANKKNICRHSLPAVRARELDSLCLRFNVWVDDLGAPVAREAESLLWLKGQDDDLFGEGDRVDMVVLLVDPVYQPKMQYWARCCLLGEDGVAQFRMPDAWPVVVSICSREARLSPNFRTLDLVTSDELALQLTSGTEVWQLIPLVWEFADTDSVLDMVITGAGEPFVKAPKVPKTKVATVDLAAEVDVADPIAHGRAGAWASTSAVRPAEPAGPAEPADGPSDGADDEEAFADMGAHAEAENVVGLSADVLEDIHEQMGFVMCVGEPVDAFGVGDEDKEAALEVAMVDSDVDEECEAAEALFPVEAPPEAASFDRVPPSIEECIMGAVVSDLGYVALSLPPWDQFPAVGRITTWPKDQPES